MLVVSAPGTLVHLNVRVLLEDVDGVERHLVDPVDLVALQVGNHRVGVRVVRQGNRLHVRLLAPVVRIGDEGCGALLLVGLNGEAPPVTIEPTSCSG